MKPKVYVETSIVSVLTSRPSRDVEQLAQQQYTLEWWDAANSKFELVISDFVLQEARLGDAVAAKARLDALRAATAVLDIDDAQAGALADILLKRGALPAKARFDALHVAACACAGVEFLASWNYKHLANAQRAVFVEQVCRQAGYEPPRITTLYELSLGD